MILTLICPGRRLPIEKPIGAFQLMQDEVADMYVALNPIYADAVFDRLAHNAHRLDLDGDIISESGVRSSRKRGAPS